METINLQVGNWVDIAMEGYNNPTQISEVGSFYVKAVEDNKDYGWVVVKPIILTKEMLLKNGYGVEHEGTEMESLISEDRRITLNANELFLNSYNTWYVHIDNEDMETIGTCELTYVHQFQNFLNLLGVDNNFKL